MPEKFAEPGREGGAIEACQMDDLLYPERSIDHLDFFANEGYFFAYSTSLYVYIFLIASVIKSFFLKS